MRRRARAMRRVVAALLAVAVLGGCGKKGAPVPVGPADQITYPRVYPTF